MLEKENDILSCGLGYTTEILGGKWKPYILWHLNTSPDGVCRYGELKRKIPFPVSHKMFTQQLRELEDDGIINRMEYDEKPVRVEYSLTPKGKLLLPIMLFFRDYGVMYSDHIKIATLEGTRGNWIGDTIYYQYEDEELGLGIDLRFKVGRPRNDEIK